MLIPTLNAKERKGYNERNIHKIDGEREESGSIAQIAIVRKEEGAKGYDCSSEKDRGKEKIRNWESGRPVYCFDDRGEEHQ